MPDIQQNKPDIQTLEKQKDIEGLIEALSYDDFEIHSAAVTAIYNLGDPAILRLLRDMKTKNLPRRLGIIEALGKLKDPRALEPLIQTLADENPEIRWDSAISLGGLDDKRAIPALRKALEDNDKYVRYGAASALSKIGWIPSDNHEKALLFMGMQEWWVLKQMGKQAVPALAVALQDRESSVRLKVIETLGEIHDKDSAPLLIRALGDENADVRWKAVLASTKSGIPLMYLPRGLSRRPRIRKNPKIAAILNFLLPGQGYNYLGKWWGILIFQLDVTVTLWLLRFGGESLSYTILFPLYVLIAIHAGYIAMKMPDL
jgi:hypothetical protein